MTQKIAFVKMHGIGNDYVYIDCFKQDITGPERLARIMSPRRFSVGADGVILICPSEVADGKMRMFNLDGSEAKMCGNGIRCVGKYLYDSGIARKETITVETLSGIKELKVTEKNGKAELLSVDMGTADFNCESVPAVFSKPQMIDEPLSIGKKEYRVTAVSIGNPHAVMFCDEIADLPLDIIGPQFEKSGIFPQSVNAEFVKVINGKELQMRVFERGSGETLACGTGACAVVAAAVKNGICAANEEVTVHLAGGDLTVVYFDNGRVLMTGEAKKVYEGVFEYEP